MQGREFTLEEMEEIKSKILEFLSGGFGRVFYAACQFAGISSALAYKWRSIDPAFERGIKEALAIGMENALDVAENGSTKLLQNEDPKHVRWFLETKGKTRGYVKRVETFARDKESMDVEAENARESIFGEEVPAAAPGDTPGETGKTDGQTGDSPKS